MTGLGPADGKGKGKGEGTKGSDGTQSQWFLEKDWGEKACLLQLTIVLLTHKHWDMIKSEADAHLKVKPQMLSRTESATSHIQRIPSPSSPKAAPKLKYSHVVGSTP